MMRIEQMNGATSAWATAALDAEISRVRTAPPSTANVELNAAAYALGQLVGAGALDRTAVDAALKTAARDRAIPLAEAGATIRSGMEAGIRQPRDMDHVGSDHRGTPRPPRAAPTTPETETREQARNRVLAEMRWKMSAPIEGTLAARYLAARGITLALSASLRFESSGDMIGGSQHPIMLAAVIEPTTGRFLAIQRTALRPDGSGKAAIEPAKASLGSTKGGAVVLGDLDAGDGQIIEGEGVETTLSALQATGLPGIATLSVGTLGRPPLPPGRRVIILADRGNEAEARKGAERRIAEGRVVHLALPPEGDGIGDFNDALRLLGEDAVRAAIEAAELVTVPAPDLERQHGAAPRAACPDMTIIQRATAPAPTLDLTAFGPLASLIKQAAECKGAPIDYVTFALLGAAAGAVGASRWVSPWSGWSEPAIIWTMLVGSPSAAKSPAMDAMRAPLSEVENGAAAGWPETRREYESAVTVAEAERERWQGEVKAAVKGGATAPLMPHAAVSPPEPQMPRIVVTDVTIEDAAAKLAGNPRGLVLWRDECAGWLANLNKFGDGDRAFWLECYGGRPYIVDRRKLAEPLRIEHTAVSITGGIQPDRLASLVMTGDDDGLVARFVYTWPEPVPPNRPHHNLDSGLVTRALKRLRGLDFRADPQTGRQVPVTLPIEGAALNLFQEWREEHYAASQGTSGLLSSAFGKMPGQALRLALLIELLKWAAGPEGEPEPVEVSAASLGAALDMIEGYVKPMLDRVLGEAALPQADRHAAMLGRAIVSRRATTINARSVRREWRLPGLREASAVSMAIGALEEAGWLTPAGGREGGSAGRQRGDYLVHPSVHGGRP